MLQRNIVACNVRPALRAHGKQYEDFRGDCDAASDHVPLQSRRGFARAPYSLYKNDALHIDAITLERDEPPREPKLGTFKLDGLKDIEL
jgi:hypothetical protein